jgi:hypothetical protein
MSGANITAGTIPLTSIGLATTTMTAPTETQIGYTIERSVLTQTILTDSLSNKTIASMTLTGPKESIWIISFYGVLHNVYTNKIYKYYIVPNISGSNQPFAGDSFITTVSYTLPNKATNNSFKSSVAVHYILPTNNQNISIYMFDCPGKLSNAYFKATRIR